MKRIQFLFLFLFIAFTRQVYSLQSNELPNILWLTSEDNSTFLRCYGDMFATTPNLDKLATQGFLYTHFYSSAPVCAPSRNTIITGIYANSGGNENMRSKYPMSETIKTYPEFLRKMGYYCTNNSKTDYNTSGINPDLIWDECSNKAHYKNRKPGQPFFAVFNSTITHESSIHKYIHSSQLKHDPEKVPLPPFHPATEEIKHDWAQYYDKVEEMDAWIGTMLKELDSQGLSENTIVFYYADNGGVLPWSKRFLYERGTHVPLIIRIPEKYKYLFPAKTAGSRIDRLVNFADLFPTLLSIAGIKIPPGLQGDAFLGKQQSKEPEYTFMFRNRMDERYDLSRAVRDKKFRYIRNYMPYRIYGQHLEYLWNAPSTGSWEKEFRAGKCSEIQSSFWKTKQPEELYDTENDPWEINNLASDPNHLKTLVRMRKACDSWMLKIKDAGLIPESDLNERTKETSAYDYMRSGEVNLEELLKAANLALLAQKQNTGDFITYLKNSDSAIRYWGATGLLILGDKATECKAELEAALSDKSAAVICVAAEALYNMGETAQAEISLTHVLESGNEYSRVYALNTIDCLNINSPALLSSLIKMTEKSLKSKGDMYDIRCAKWLFQKWGLNPENYNIKI